MTNKEDAEISESKIIEQYVEALIKPECFVLKGSLLECEENAWYDLLEQIQN